MLPRYFLWGKKMSDTYSMDWDTIWTINVYIDLLQRKFFAYIKYVNIHIHIVFHLQKFFHFWLCKKGQKTSEFQIKIWAFLFAIWSPTLWMNLLLCMYIPVHVKLREKKIAQKWHMFSSLLKAKRLLLIKFFLDKLFLF